MIAETLLNVPQMQPFHPLDEVAAGLSDRVARGVVPLQDLILIDQIAAVKIVGYPLVAIN